MRKLFKMDPSVLIDNYSSIRITGPCSLLKLGPASCAIRSGDYVIEVAGSDLHIETLSEEVAILHVSSIERLSIGPADEEGIGR